MSLNQLFSICNSLAFFSWIVLSLFTFWKSRVNYIFSVVIILLAIVYAWLMFSNITLDGFKNFGTLDGVSTLFADKNLLLAGWIHYLAFDLLTGIFIVTNAKKNNINHWIIVPTLFLTFMLGPVGLLAYFLIRLIKTRTYMRDNF